MKMLEASRGTRAAPWLALAMLAFTGCPDPGEEPCTGAICTGTMDSGPGTRRDGGTTPPGDGGITPRMDGDVCVESWSCTPWETNGTTNAASRTCTDANACGSTANRPLEAVDLPDLDFNFYHCNVEPILDRGCAQLGCHGTEQGRELRIYHRGRLRITGSASDPASEQLHKLSGCLDDPSILVLPQTCIGSIECECAQLPHTPRELRRNFDAARGLALDDSGNPLADMADSELLTQPEVGGGFPHANVHFWRPGDTDYQTILSWLGGQTRATCNTMN